jgi:hemolysin D
VKIDAFPCTKYGSSDAELINLSDDVVPDEKFWLIYTARLLLKQSAIREEEKMINLTPVEIKTGKRRLIEYVLNLLMQYADESVRER